MTVLDDRTAVAPPTPLPALPDRRRRRRTALGRVARMTRFELTMIFRQKVALMSILLAPATAIGIASFTKPVDDAAWLSLLSSMAVLVLILAVYTTTTSTVVSRRENQVLKRFRTSELLPRQMLFSLAAPYVLVGIGQVVVLTAAYQAMGAPSVARPELFALVVVATTVMSVLAGFATGTMTANSERVQFGVMPIMMTGLVTSIMVLNPGLSDNVRGLVLLAPYASSSDLAARALGAPADTFATPAVVVDLAERLDVSASLLMTGANSLLLAFWCLVFVQVARSKWRWEPRG
ncbi:ABC transporter permease [Nocardioides sp. C4-1]|uniref:ABC transporter permease n=1 Tax=Nocardioides sp. C4-1 TaxID=3151851 RepID=UPI003263643F